MDRQAGRPAARDLDKILEDSARLFGGVQARRYHQQITAAILELQRVPDHPMVRRGEALPDGLKTLQVQRRGRRARHLLLYKVAGEHSIEVLRILHDAMDLPRHLPAEDND